MMRFVVLLAAFSAVSGLNVEATDPNRPVSKVVALIKDMVKTLEKEAEEDEDIYDKLMCWCETYDKEKTAAIAEGEAKVKQLTKTIEETAARVAQLTAEIENLQKEVAASQKALDKADAIRQQELADFVAEEKDSLQAISALKSAVTVLSKHHGGASFLQTEARLSTVVNAIHIVAWKSKDMYVPLEHKKIMNSFLEENGQKDFFDAGPIGGQSYAPKSGAIFGILKQMQETFESNIAEAQKTETAAKAAFEELKEAKEEEIQAGTDQINTKSEELAAAKTLLEESKVSLEDTKAQLTEDEKFLAMLKEKCSMTDGEWEERQKARQLEVEACNKALAILNSDEAHATFSRTFNSAESLLQTSSSARREAAEVLRAAHSPKLAAIALKVKLDAFEKVHAAIDEMIADLTKQQTDEVKQRDWCIAELNKNEADQVSTKRDIGDAQKKIDKLDEAIMNSENTIAESQKSIKETQDMMKKAGEEREAQNAEFQTTVKDQKASIALLTQALQVLEKAFAASLLQQAPPAGFTDYKKNSHGGGVVQMIKDIIADAGDMLAKAEEEEGRAQADYESLVQESNENIDTNEATIASENEAKAGHEQDKVDTQELQRSKLQEMDELKITMEDVHAECDFVLKHFEDRQKARQGEIDALNKAKGILSGAKFEE